MMRALRSLQVLGTVLLVFAVVVFVIYPASRPGGSAVALWVAVGAALGLLTGLLVRVFVPLDRRLRALRELSPRAGGSIVDRHERHRGPPKDGDQSA